MWPSAKVPRSLSRAQITERWTAKKSWTFSLLSGDCADTPGMITAAVVAKAAALGGLRASLTAILLSLGNRAGAFRVCAFVLDCFGHQISPVGYLVYRSSMHWS
jgi:hypothetical protein